MPCGVSAQKNKGEWVNITNLVSPWLKRKMKALLLDRLGKTGKTKLK